MKGNPALDAVLGRAFGQRRTACVPPPPDHLAALHVLAGVAGVHAPDVRADRAAIAVRSTSLKLKSFVR
jgi:hypothetical protein